MSTMFGEAPPAGSASRIARRIASLPASSSVAKSLSFTPATPYRVSASPATASKS